MIGICAFLKTCYIYTELKMTIVFVFVLLLLY